MGIESDSIEAALSKPDACESVGIESDAIGEAIGGAGRIGAHGEPAKPLVTLRGWVVAGDPVTRLYPDPSCVVWLEIPNCAIVRQIRGCERAHDEQRSLLWVSADALVTTCRVSSAADSTASATPATHELMLAAIWPRPKP
jgi:hypothetical protein